MWYGSFVAAGILACGSNRATKLLAKAIKTDDVLHSLYSCIANKIIIAMYVVLYFETDFHMNGSNAIAAVVTLLVLLGQHQNQYLPLWSWLRHEEREPVVMTIILVIFLTALFFFLSLLTR